MLVHNRGKYQDFLQLNEIGSKNCTRIVAAIPYAIQGAASEDFYETIKEAEVESTTYCRLDWSIPFDTRIISTYSSKSLSFFFIEEYLHAKVVWWQNWGAYIGSCNLTDRACFENHEAGFFIEQEAMQRMGLDRDLSKFFEHLQHEAITPSTETFALLEKQNQRLSEFRSMRYSLSKQFTGELRALLSTMEL